MMKLIGRTIVIGLISLVTLPGGGMTAGLTPEPIRQQPPATEAELIEARERLAELGYWLDPEADLTHPSFRHALIAFQKVEGRPRTGRLTTPELEAIRVAAPPLPIEAGGLHLEVDLYRQILLLVDTTSGLIRILPISSGSGECFTEGGRTRRAITPPGRFVVNRKIAGWRKSSLGSLYYPLYFHYGVAIHGSGAVPTHPASHGCIRVPLFAAAELASLVPEGTPVIIYDPNPFPPKSPLPCPIPASVTPPG